MVNDFYFPCHKQQIIGMTADAVPTMPWAVAHLIVEYVTAKDNPFGAKDWLAIFNVGVDHYELPLAFYKQVWHAKDKVNPSQLVSDTHLPPILLPSHVVYISEMGNYKKERYSVALLRTLICKHARSTKEEDDSDVHRQVSFHSKWLMLRKSITARNQSAEKQRETIQIMNEKTGSNYELIPSLLDLLTSVCIRHCIHKRMTFMFPNEVHIGSDIENASLESTCRLNSDDQWNFHTVKGISNTDQLPIICTRRHIILQPSKKRGVALLTSIPTGRMLIPAEKMLSRKSPQKSCVIM